MDIYRDIYGEGRKPIEVAEELVAMIPEDAQLLTAHQYKTAKKEDFALADGTSKLFPLGTKGDAVLSMAYLIEKSAELTPAATKYALDKIAEKAVLSSWLDVYEHATKLASKLIEEWEVNGLTDGIKTASYDETVPCALVDDGKRKYATITEEVLEESITTFINEYTFVGEEDRVKVAESLISAAGTHGVEVGEGSVLRKIASGNTKNIFLGNILETVKMEKEFDLSSKARTEVSVQRFKEASYDPSVMRGIAIELVKAADHHDIPVDASIRKYASEIMNPNIKTAMYDRLSYVRDVTVIEEVKDLVKRAEAELFTPTEFVEAVEKFDKSTGIHRLWGTNIQSPIDTVLGDPGDIKVAEMVSNDKGGGDDSSDESSDGESKESKETKMDVEFEGQKLTLKQFKQALKEKEDEISSLLNDSVIEGLNGNDFVKNFENLPEETKRTLMSIIIGKEPDAETV